MSRCGHCKALAPEYERVAERNNVYIYVLMLVFSKEKNAAAVEVDCDVHKDLCSKYGVHGYPTIKYFPKGDAENPIEYVAVLLL